MKTVTEFPDLEAPVREKLEQKRRVFPCRSNRASQLGHPCVRFLYYCRANWQERKVPELTLQYIFGEGNIHEEDIFQRLKDAGWKVSNQQRDFEDAKLGITGHVDGFLELDGELYPLESKSMANTIWPTIHTVDDMKHSKRPWIRTYPAQLNLYMYLSEKPYGVFYLKNKGTGEGKSIWMELDYELAEDCLQKAETVNNHLELSTPPVRIPYDPNTCLNCDFEHICLPQGEGRGILFEEYEPEIEKLLARRAELEPTAKEYQDIDKQVKAYAKDRGAELLNIGDWLVEIKVSTYMTKATEAKETTRTTVKISRLGEEGE